MNKNLGISIALVVVLGLGLWWFVGHSNPEDSVTPTATASVSASPTSPNPTATQPAITITSPTANQVVDSLITVTGKARIFENQFTVQLKDSAGKVIYQAHVMTDAKDAGLFGNYSVKIPVPAGLGSNFKIEALSLSPKGDGSFEGYASVPVKLKSTDTSSVYAAFTAGDDCTTVTLFPRVIIKSQEVLYMSLSELLKGPTPEEVSKGAGNQIPSGVKLNSLRRTGNTAYADFDQTLQQGVAGSCRVQVIRSQITNTMKQFVGIDNVVISINGQTEGILQP
jgi:hypothetical protein